MRKVLYFLFLVMCVACQKEQEPLTLEQIRDLNTFKVVPFDVRINGTRFSGDNISAVKLNKRLSLQAEIENQFYAISTEDLSKGVYLGENNRLKNTISFTNMNGVTFTSTKQGETSDAVIEIENYDEQRKLVSGIISGTLYAPWNESIQLEFGRFQDVFVETPFLGVMNADVDTKLFDSEQCIHAFDTLNGIVFNTFTSTANCDTLSLNFRIQGGLAVGSYDINNQDVTVSYNSNTFSLDVFRNQFTSDSGTLTITAINTTAQTVSGTFNLQATNFIGQQIDITNGNFTATMN